MKQWYYRVVFENKDYKIHRLVWFAFIPNPNNKPYINHKNWIKTDNRVENLEWVTASENTRHAFDTWLKKITENNYFLKNHPTRWKFWKDNPKSIAVSQYSLNWIFIKKYSWILEAKRYTWVSDSSISCACRWKLKTAWWFIWKYA